MRKIMFLALLLIVIKAEAQQEVTVKIKYEPGRTYDALLSLNLNCSINASGDSDMIKKITSKGLTLPLSLTLGGKIGFQGKTGALAADNSFPFSMNFKINSADLALNGNSIPIPKKLDTTITMFGKIMADGRMIADSVPGMKMKDSSAQSLSKSLNMIQNRIKFPDRPMHIGDTITRDLPFPMKMTGISATIRTIYKLVNIADGKAYFDVNNFIDIKANIKTIVVSITGSGTGKVVYSIKDNFITEYSNSAKIKLNGQVNKLVVTGDITMNSYYKIDIH